jgi:hypothetical protein
MRELGGMRRLVDDDVRTRLQSTDRRGLARRRAPVLKELTSRMHSADIPQILDQLERPFTAPEGAAIRRASDSTPTARAGTPLDVLLATNMVSVGMDVKRLGLMVVSGQPGA